jgi:hypothetical protein
MMRRITLAVFGVSLLGCHVFGQENGRYIVTATPVDVLDGRHPGVCVAVDPTDVKGVWWWEPGRSGCASRSTGPNVFVAKSARVTKTAREIDVQFDLPLTAGHAVHVKLRIDDNGIRREGSSEQVSIERRRNLDVPESCCPSS